MKTSILTVMQHQLHRANVRFALAAEGFDVVESRGIGSIREQMNRNFSRLVVIGLSEPASLELCRKIRHCSDIPIMLQLPLPNEQSEWMAFQAGANDVITEHISRRLLVARVNALLLRHQSDEPCSDRTLGIGALLLDLDARTLHVDDRPVDLTRTEFDLLAQLMSQPRRVHIRGDLVMAVWGEHYPEHVLETHLSRLRKKVRIAGGPTIGYAVRGIGYRLGVSKDDTAQVS